MSEHRDPEPFHNAISPKTQRRISIIYSSKDDNVLWLFAANIIMKGCLLQFMEWGECTQDPWHLMADGSGSKVAVEKYCSRSYLNIFKPTKCLLSQIRISSSWKHQNVCQELMELRIFLLIVTSQPRSYFECLFWGSYFVKQIQADCYDAEWVNDIRGGWEDALALICFTIHFCADRTW